MAAKLQRRQALIIGASRGIGLGLTREYLQRGWNVLATVRTAITGGGLEDYYDQLTLDTLDINHLHMVDDFMARLHGRVFDVIVLNAGVYGPKGKAAAAATPEEITHLMMTNAIAPLRLAARLLPHLRPETGVLAFMSSVMGSLEVNMNDGSALYAASKTMLNRMSRAFAAEYEYLTVVNLHPGWVRTSMGGEAAPLDVETSAKGLVNVLEARAGKGGHEFLDYRGKIIPW